MERKLFQDSSLAIPKDMLIYTHTNQSNGKDFKMAGFTDWIFENVQISFIITAAIACSVIYAEPFYMFRNLILTFVIAFLITCLIRFISIIIYNVREAE